MAGKNVKTKAKSASKKAGVPKKAAASKSKKLSSKVAKPKAKKESVAMDTQGVDRKGLAARARLLKTELLAIRFNIQAPNLKDYKNKKRELATLLAQLG